MLDINKNDNKSNASIGGINLPDYFSCRNCRGWYQKYLTQETWRMCLQLRESGACAKLALAAALKSGAVTIHLHLAVGGETDVLSVPTVPMLEG